MFFHAWRNRGRMVPSPLRGFRPTGTRATGPQLLTGMFRLPGPITQTWGTISGLSVLICVFPGKYCFKYQSSYTLVHTLSSSRIPLPNRKTFSFFQITREKISWKSPFKPIIRNTLPGVATLKRNVTFIFLSIEFLTILLVLCFVFLALRPLLSYLPDQGSKPVTPAGRQCLNRCRKAVLTPGPPGMSSNVALIFYCLWPWFSAQGQD